MRGFQTALAIGATTVEADLMLTRDRHVVVAHDPRISRKLCRGPYVGRLIKRLTLRQVQRQDCGTRRARDGLSRTQKPVPGQRIPTLRRVLGVAKKAGARLLLELKTNPTSRAFPARGALVRSVRDAVRREFMVRRVTVQSYAWGALRLMHRLEPRVELMVLASRHTTYPRSPWLAGTALRRAPGGTGIVRAAHRAGFDGIAPDRRLVTPQMVALAHARELRVIPYTVDTVEEMGRLIGLGVDGLITDFPDLLRDAARL